MASGLESKSRLSDRKVKENIITCNGTIQNDCTTNGCLLCYIKDGKIQKGLAATSEVERASYESLGDHGLLGDQRRALRSGARSMPLTKMGVWSHEREQLCLRCAENTKQLPPHPDAIQLRTDIDCSPSSRRIRTQSTGTMWMPWRHCSRTGRHTC